MSNINPHNLPEPGGLPPSAAALALEALTQLLNHHDPSIRIEAAKAIFDHNRSSSRG